VDNLEAAKPLLEHYAAPATVFVASGYTGRSEGFWWDRLAAAILVPAVLPAKLSLGHGETRFFWDDPRLVRADEGGRRARKRLHDALWNWLIDHIERERSWEIAKIEDWAGASRKDDHSSWPMNAQQIHDLVSGGLVDIGAHGVSHRRLTRLSRADKQEEIVRSRRDCEQISGAAPACFAFPNGDYDVECLEFVRQEGFLVGCTSRAGLAWASSDPLQVPRVSVRDVDGASLWREVRRKWLT
jgi:peptidoglycan/xylan/chitin deacetylase (PgdA/CDA1 family)